MAVHLEVLINMLLAFQCQFFLYPLRNFIYSFSALRYWPQRAVERLGTSPLKWCLKWKEFVVITDQKQGWNTPRWAWGEQVYENVHFSIQYFDTVGWV